MASCSFRLWNTLSLNVEYDEEKGYPEGGIAPGTKWEDVPQDFECPLCAVGKDQFSAV